MDHSHLEPSTVALPASVCARPIRRQAMGKAPADGGEFARQALPMKARTVVGDTAGATTPARPRGEIGFHVKQDSAPYRVKRK